MSQTDRAEASKGEAGTREKNRFRSTLNLPKTSFPMKANLVQNEPASQKRWDAMGVYQRLREARAGRERYVFHDGPPYANASLHMGHLLNKTLKDFIVRSQSMMGRDCPFVPGWDCHGLPIEHRVMTDLIESGKLERLASLEDTARRLAIRRECEKHAHKSQKLQAGQMRRLLTLADYENPYLTLDPAYEGAVLDVLASMIEQGVVYRALKAVHWSVANETALAEAELEYHEREDISVYVDFEASDKDAVYEAFGLEGEDRPGVTPSLMIWTTTPWTLPANMAMAVNTGFSYALVRVDGNVTVIAEELVERVTKAAGAERVEVLAKAPGERLLGLGYRHPFREAKPELEGDLSKVWTVLAAEYVTLEDGTGIVHTATGHGAEDYQTGVREGIPIYCPVLEDGTYDGSVPEWLRGVSVWEANTKVTEHLRATGHLFHDEAFTHSYPHDWRSKTPVIFRATEQWFVGVDTPMARDRRTLRGAALADIESVAFVPSWGRHRMRGMLENRPDWCISRQRSWGLPIPAFYTPEGEPFMTPRSVRAVAEVVRAQGSDAWFKLDAADLLARYEPAEDPDAPDGLDPRALTRGTDILDVWFESGSSWNAVMRLRSGGEAFPIRVYVEGSDQHRGWFQTSLLPSLAVMGRPAYEAIVTHGFMVDREGHKLSKSKGHTLEDLFQTYGADVIRWWVSSLSYEGDMKVDDELFRVAGESYRKIRNTLRFMLSNLGDASLSELVPGDPAPERPALDDVAPTSPEAWVLGEYDRVATDVIDAFERFDFQRAHRTLYHFCSHTLSAVYLASVKDRLYCDAPDSARRRRTQRALALLTHGLTRLLAPVLCHTADEAYRALLGVDAKDQELCVHLAEYVRGFGVTRDEGWPAVMRARDATLLALERSRAEGGLENPLDAGAELPDPDGVLSRFHADDLADLMGVSRASVNPELTEVRLVDLRDQPRCERSWKRTPDVRERSDGSVLSDRDAAAVGV